MYIVCRKTVMTTDILKQRKKTILLNNGICNCFILICCQKKNKKFFHHFSQFLKTNQFFCGCFNIIIIIIHFLFVFFPVVYENGRISIFCTEVFKILGKQQQNFSFANGFSLFRTHFFFSRRLTWWWWWWWCCSRRLDWGRRMKRKEFCLLTHQIHVLTKLKNTNSSRKVSSWVLWIVAIKFNV